MKYPLLRDVGIFILQMLFPQNLIAFNREILCIFGLYLVLI